MINYSKSKIYFIKRRDTDEIVWCAGTVSNLSRKYYNHKSNQNDLLYKKINQLGLDWRNLKIELVKEYDTCRDRKTLRFASDTVYCYFVRDNSEVFHYFLNNIDYFIE